MKRILQYVLLTFVFSWLMWGLQFLGQDGYLPEWVQIFGMFGLFGPLIAFLILIKRDGLKYKNVFKELFQKAKLWIILFAILSPFILSGLAYIAYLYFESGSGEPITITFVSFLLTALMILFVGGPIEEFGWRGYLMPKLKSRYSIFVTILIVGLIHGLWHLPLHYLNGTVQQAIPIYEFLIITIAITVSYGFIYEYTKSLIPMIILHWMSNLSSAVFPYYYSVQGRYALLIFTICLDIVLLVLIKRRNTRGKNID